MSNDLIPQKPTDAPSTESSYSEQSFWTKLRDFAKAAGETIVEKALALYYCAADTESPAWAKAVIYAALGYFILPLDAIPDALPVVGYSDDLGALAAALASVAAHLKPEHTARARETLRTFFGRSDP